MNLRSDEAARSADTCAGCTGACCVGVLVGITGYDAWRIARANALRLEQFVTIASADPETPGAFRFEGGFGVLVLERRTSDSGSACVFLMASADGTRLCGTHPSRPRVCRSYPMTRVGDGVALRADVVCGADDWNIRRITGELWLDDIDAEASEWDAYARIVAVFNRCGDGKVDSYLAFIVRLYDEIDRLGVSDGGVCEAIAMTLFA